MWFVASKVRTHQPAQRSVSGRTVRPDRRARIVGGVARPSDLGDDEIGEPALAPQIEAAHLAAVRAGEPGYLDPDTGLFVLTAISLAARGRCCGEGCRHCPFPI